MWARSRARSAPRWVEFPPTTTAPARPRPPRATARARGRCRGGWRRGRAPGPVARLRRAARAPASATIWSQVHRSSPTTIPAPAVAGPGEQQFGDGVHGPGRPRSMRSGHEALVRAPVAGYRRPPPNIGTRCIFDGKMVRSEPSERSVSPWSSGSSTPSASCPSTARPTAPSAEHDRIMDELAYIRAADGPGFKYSWSSEHHFLTDYSHLSANESFMAFAAAQTKNIHLGSGIFNLTPPANHPARVAERVAMLDHLSEGRFEFGTGRGRRPPSRRASASRTRSSPARWWPRRSRRSSGCGRRRTTPTTASSSPCPPATCSPSPTPTRTRRCGWRRAAPAPSSSPPARASVCCASPSASPKGSRRSSRSTRRRSRTPSPSADTSTTTS